MNYEKKVLEHYKIELTEDSYDKFVDLSIYRMLTADNYDLWMVNPEGGLGHYHNIDWEHDVFMYKDNIAEVLFNRMVNKNKSIEEIWYIEDIDEIFEDYQWAEEWEKINKENNEN